VLAFALKTAFHGAPRPARRVAVGRQWIFRDHRTMRQVIAAELVPANLAQAASDERLITMWLHGRNLLTRNAYERDAQRFFAFVQKPIRAITLGDLHAWLDQLQGAPASRARRLAAVKSLLTFATRLGYLPLNVGAAVRAPVVTRVLAERILSEEEVVRMIALERDPRNHALVRLLYIAALRVSEAARLKWKDCLPRETGGQITVIGKRDKVRTILLPGAMWRELMALKADRGSEDPVFRSRQDGHLDPMTIERLVKRAAARAGLAKEVSPHWLRHAHCSHALQRGCNPALVRDTAGHSDLKVTSVYSHARPNESSALFLIG
jgi:integrase/recombinase XerD